MARRSRSDARRAGLISRFAISTANRSSASSTGVEPLHEPINETHVAQPGPAVVEVATADDQTAFAIQEALAGRWSTAPADRTPRAPGVWPRCYLGCAPGPQLLAPRPCCPGPGLRPQGRSATEAVWSAE
ncbi:DUF6207 family protein [Streptomyces collinus]|uniref:DUF6207 family protein n=1 Tax=Streptomyces collinus TaxID=42684 RepID=UPI0033C78E63